MDLWRWIRNQSDRALAIGLTVAGLVVIFFGWLGVSGHVLPAEQIPYLAGDAVVGLFLLGVAATLWLSADMRDEWRKLDVVAEELRRANDLAESEAAQRAAAPKPAARSARQAR